MTSQMNPPELDLSRPVLVTGASGYVAGLIVKVLLDAGYTVHGTVRDPGSPGKTDHLRKLDPSGARLKLFQADLLKPGSFGEAMKGCQTVFHTASPYILKVKDAQKQLIEPALEGTRNVLSEVNRTPSVKRVVLTSSCAAICGDSADLASTPRGVFDEEVWNTSSSLDHIPYSYSKVLAEKEAWRIHAAQSRWSLVVLNPAAVMGPGISPDGSSESFNWVKQMGDGTLKFGAPDIRIGVVDVRDLAEAHLRAATHPAASGRYVIVGHDSSFPEMASVLLEKYGDRFPLPRKTIPKAILWLFGPFIDSSLTRRFVSRNIGLPWKSDNSKAIRELGMRYRGLKETMNDFFEQLVVSGQIRSRK